MKLRNKKTGEIIETNILYVSKYETLAELNEEWEDYEEPKEYWYIDYDGGILCGEKDGSSAERMMISMGNYFESLEEAEKAVEKLRAWKRLKDKGFRFTGIAGISNDIHVSFETDSKYDGGHIMYDKYSNTDDNLRKYNEDLMLLFGGEE